MHRIDQIDCDHDYAEVVIHVDMTWGQQVRVQRCEYCGDTRLPAGFASIPAPMLQVLGVHGPHRAPRVLRVNRQTGVEMAWRRLKEQHREFVDASLSARA